MAARWAVGLGLSVAGYNVMYSWLQPQPCYSSIAARRLQVSDVTDQSNLGSCRMPIRATRISFIRPYQAVAVPVDRFRTREEGFNRYRRFGLQSRPTDGIVEVNVICSTARYVMR